jgi:hypothetical protein
MNIVLRAKVVVCLLAGFVATGALHCVAQSGAQGASPPAAQAPAREVWQREFDRICSRTQEAMSFSEEELASLVQRCDALAPQIEKLDETRRKVYLGRLHMCRGLYAYVLESKRNQKK